MCGSGPPELADRGVRPEEYILHQLVEELDDDEQWGKLMKKWRIYFAGSFLEKADYEQNRRVPKEEWKTVPVQRGQKYPLEVSCEFLETQEPEGDKRAGRVSKGSCALS